MYKAFHGAKNNKASMSKPVFPSTFLKKVDQKMQKNQSLQNS
jgi:hypothetical protein